MQNHLAEVIRIENNMCSRIMKSTYWTEKRELRIRHSVILSPQFRVGVGEVALSVTYREEIPCMGNWAWELNRSQV